MVSPHFNFNKQGLTIRIDIRMQSNASVRHLPGTTAACKAIDLTKSDRPTEWRPADREIAWTARWPKWLAGCMLALGFMMSPAPADYLTWQTYAMSARHGMWATYVLDMDEWRAKAVDRTLARRPIADFNLLAERDSEISPPFEDARNRPGRTNR